MSVRDTSVQTWREINDNGLLSKVRLEIYNALYQHGPCTYNELFVEMQKYSKRANFNVNTRLGELRNMGVVSEVGEGVCKVTGMTVIIWDVTSKLPVEMPRRKTKRQKIAELVRALELHRDTYHAFGNAQKFSINNIITLVKDV